ncbi:hypothetical protein L1887_51330 [Cichorium endivia]|nr:hypothetical protein L1887_51330 [Cichorium endivia]
MEGRGEGLARVGGGGVALTSEEKVDPVGKHLEVGGSDVLEAVLGVGVRDDAGRACDGADVRSAWIVGDALDAQLGAVGAGGEALVAAHLASAACLARMRERLRFGARSPSARPVEASLGSFMAVSNSKQCGSMLAS